MTVQTKSRKLMTAHRLAYETTQNFRSHKAVSHYARRSYLLPSEEYLIGKYFSKDGSTLDLGCGSGRTTLPLCKQGFDLVGVDISLPLLRELQQRSQDVQLVCADASKLPFRLGTFENVLFSFNGIDYIYPDCERKDTLKSIRDIMKRKGTLIFSSHSPIALGLSIGLVIRCWYGLLLSKIRHNDFYYQKVDEFAPLLTRHITAREERRELKLCGLQLIEVSLNSLYGHKLLRGLLLFMIEKQPYYVCRSRHPLES
jgi:SAM-dependent methyltransferase